VVDLAEIADTENHLNILTALSQIIPPDLIWICNGSPWLVEHATHLRRLFANVPIVDQQVYDTEEGWIQYYDKKGIQSFDHFIAINSKIRNKFIQEIKIPTHRVSLIYPAFNREPVLSARLLGSSRLNGRRELGIPEYFDKLFIFVGRLTDQKNPLSFLELVRSAQKTHPTAFFIMIGDGEMAAKCDEFIKANHIINIRRISYHPRPPEIMVFADGMIITSIYEGLPIAMLEALAVGIPVLATDVGDIRLVLEEYGAGVVSNDMQADGPPQLKLKDWENFVQNHKNLQNCAQANKDKVLSSFDSKAISNQYEKLFSVSTKHT
jgi:glycosyltransferase involved in cell wall biosynthesis